MVREDELKYVIKIIGKMGREGYAHGCKLLLMDIGNLMSYRFEEQVYMITNCVECL